MENEKYLSAFETRLYIILCILGNILFLKNITIPHILLWENWTLVSHVTNAIGKYEVGYYAPDTKKLIFITKSKYERLAYIKLCFKLLFIYNVKMYLFL